jgi:hypothetical protein
MRNYKASPDQRPPRGTLRNIDLSATVSWLAQDPDSAKNTAYIESVVKPLAPTQADLSIHILHHQENGLDDGTTSGSVGSTATGLSPRL